jgi:hypothetical protein
MNGLTLLHEVAETYRNLKSLTLQAAIVTESGDETASQRGEQRVRFFYSAPDRIRFEPCGKTGLIQVADGKQLHTCFAGSRHFARQERYTRVPLGQAGPLPHLFQPEFPSVSGGGEAFLFQTIDSRVLAADVLREEEGNLVVSVTYEALPDPQLRVAGSPVLFWVSAENRMVVRQHGKLGHRFPAEDEIVWSRQTVAVRSMRVNEPIPEETFQFTPPPDAQLETGRGRIEGGLGGGFGSRSRDGQRLEHRGSHEWDGDTLVEHSVWQIRGMKLTFERRLTFSADRKELNVDERVIGPKGDAETSCKLPVG